MPGVTEGRWEFKSPIYTECRTVTSTLLWKRASAANSIAISFCFDFSPGQPTIFACLSGGSLGDTSKPLATTLDVLMSARPNIGLFGSLATSRVPISQTSSSEIPEIRNTDVSPFLGFGKNAAYLTLLSEGLYQSFFKTNLDKISDKVTGPNMPNPYNIAFLGFLKLLKAENYRNILSHEFYLSRIVRHILFHFSR